MRSQFLLPSVLVLYHMSQIAPEFSSFKQQTFVVSHSCFLRARNLGLAQLRGSGSRSLTEVAIKVSDSTAVF